MRRASCTCRLARERFILMVVVVVEVVLGDRPVSSSINSEVLLRRSGSLVKGRQNVIGLNRFEAV